MASKQARKSGAIPVKARKTASGASSRATATHSVASAEQASYHHGDLHEALLKAAKRVAERDGINGLTLRAVAREAGVSHAAPSHHFGDMTGLLSELAAIGFKKFSASLSESAKDAHSLDEAAAGRAKAYVAFARDNPCMFQLMFRAERLDHSRPALLDASNHAFHALARVVGQRRHENVSAEHLTLEQAADIARAWSLVHGFAMLRLDGRLQGILEALPADTSEEMLLTAMLKADRPAGL